MKNAKKIRAVLAFKLGCSEKDVLREAVRLIDGLRNLLFTLGAQDVDFAVDKAIDLIEQSGKLVKLYEKHSKLLKALGEHDAEKAFEKVFDLMHIAGKYAKVEAALRGSRTEKAIAKRLTAFRRSHPEAFAMCFPLEGYNAPE